MFVVVRLFWLQQAVPWCIGGEGPGHVWALWSIGTVVPLKCSLAEAPKTFTSADLIAQRRQGAVRTYAKKPCLSAQTLRGDVWVALIGKWLEKPRNAAALAISAAWRSTFSSDPSLFNAAAALHNYHHQLVACAVMTPWFLQACLSRLRNMISGEELPVRILIPIHLRRCKANVNLAPGLTTSHNEESANHQEALLFADWFGLDWKTVI